MEYNPLDLINFGLKVTRKMQQIRHDLDEYEKRLNDLIAKRNRLVYYLDNAPLNVDDYIRANDAIASLDKDVEGIKAGQKKLEELYQQCSESLQA